ncbi:hypothetical protein [Chitinibacter sp. S2-10]|uniref:hypothetical protein n=1 Tax=Chitinibacter sp. S2-10 TaxID=3373597 RepID=UPI003977B311
MRTPEEIKNHKALMKEIAEYSDDDKRHENILKFANCCEASLGEVEGFVRNNPDKVNQFFDNLGRAGLSYSSIVSGASYGLIGESIGQINSTNDLLDFFLKIKEFILAAKMKRYNSRDLQWSYLVYSMTWVAILKGSFLFGDSEHHYLAAVKKRTKAAQKKGGDSKAANYEEHKQFVFARLDYYKRIGKTWSTMKDAARIITPELIKSSHYNQNPLKLDAEESTVLEWIRNHPDREGWFGER